MAKMTQEDKERHRDMSGDGCPNPPPFDPTDRELTAEAKEREALKQLNQQAGKSSAQRS
jgi:hypothetical protein